jgi:hypothetical protein
LSDDAVCNLGIGEREDGIGSATYFEGTGFLKIIAFKKNIRAREFVERRAGQYGSTMYFWSDASVGLLDGIPRGGGEIIDGCNLYALFVLSLWETL